jgi:hypothetical protein
MLQLILAKRIANMIAPITFKKIQAQQLTVSNSGTPQIELNPISALF